MNDFRTNELFNRLQTEHMSLTSELQNCSEKDKVKVIQRKLQIINKFLQIIISFDNLYNEL